MNGGFIPKDSFLYNVEKAQNCFENYKNQINALEKTSPHKQKELESALKVLESSIQTKDLDLLTSDHLETLEAQRQDEIEALKKKLGES